MFKFKYDVCASIYSRKIQKYCRKCILLLCVYFRTCSIKSLNYRKRLILFLTFMRMYVIFKQIIFKYYREPNFQIIGEEFENS